MDNKNIANIDEYIAQFTEDIQEKLKLIRHIIRTVEPALIEKISYQMPTFYLNGNLVHFAAYKKHIGFYPTPSGVAAFEKELSAYKTSKGAIQFPIDQPLPVELIEAIVRFRVDENKNKIAAGKKC